MATEELINAINQYGFPIIAAAGLGYFVYYIWRWATEEIDSILGEAQMTLIKLIDRVRMLDNDMIRLNTKLALALEYRTHLESNLPAEKIQELNDIVSKYQSRSQTFNSTGRSEVKPTVDNNSDNEQK